MAGASDHRFHGRIVRGPDGLADACRSFRGGTEMLLSFPLLTLLLPSATTRTGILIFVYEQALDLGHVPRGAPLAKAIMLALSSINRLASTILLTGGITPVLAASLICGISWGRWLALMCVPYGILLVGDAVLYYPAQSASSLVVYERGHLTAAEIFRFGLWMTLAAYLVVLFVALPYWQAIGEPLRLIPRG